MRLSHEKAAEWLAQMDGACRCHTCFDRFRAILCAGSQSKPARVPRIGDHAVGSRQRARRPTDSSLAASGEAAASAREVPDYPSSLDHDSYMDPE